MAAKMPSSSIGSILRLTRRGVLKSAISICRKSGRVPHVPFEEYCDLNWCKCARRRPCQARLAEEEATILPVAVFPCPPDRARRDLTAKNLALHGQVSIT